MSVAPVMPSTARRAARRARIPRAVCARECGGEPDRGLRSCTRPVATQCRSEANHEILALMATRDFEQLATTAAERDALAALRQATGAVNGPMERHCLRVRLMAAELALRREWQLDHEILTVASILHDIGLYPSVSRGGVYTADGAALARRLLTTHGWRPCAS